MRRNARPLRTLLNFRSNICAEARVAVSREEPFFRKPPYTFDRRKQALRPLAIFFEQPECADCDEMHMSALKADETRKLLARFDVYRLDVKSDAPVVTPDGANTTAARWARDLKLLYTPGVVLFDAAGREVFRIEAYVRMFHPRKSDWPPINADKCQNIKAVQGFMPITRKVNEPALARR